MNSWNILINSNAQRQENKMIYNELKNSKY